MPFTIKNVLPEYFSEDRRNTSDVWGKEIVVQNGELLKIVAPSGSGKTSLIHFLYGLRKEYTGDIIYNNQPIKNYGAEDFAQQRAGKWSIVFQDMRLFPTLTVFENINIKRQLSPHHPEQKIQEMAERLGIASKLKRTCGTCSYGEQQRVAIIRALMQPFEILLLDEPFSHLDNNNAELAMQLMLEEAKQRNAAIVFADLERVDYFPFTRLLHL